MAFVRGKFLVERDLKKHTIFLSSEEGAPPRAYGVLGLTNEIVDMLPYRLPVMIKGVLLPWKDRIILDGLFGLYPVTFGAGTRRLYRKEYNRAKAAGVVTYLDPDAAPRPPKPKPPPRKPKTLAITRFLKGCPSTVAELKEQYGEPRMEMAADAAREYSAWSPDGTPAFDVDHLMVYANIIRDQVLYVYAKEGRITRVAVVDPTDWYREDFKPHKGRRRLS